MTDVLGAWRDRGQMLEVFGRRVFALTSGPESSTHPLLVLHGFPTSSHDFADALPDLASGRRVVLFDFLGFGMSEKHPDDATGGGQEESLAEHDPAGFRPGQPQSLE